MHIIVSGASGLVGGLAVKHILSLGGHTVLATDIKPPPSTLELPSGSSFFQADLTSYEQVDALFDSSKEPIDAVIHMSAIPNPVNVDYRVCHNNNATAQYNMMYTAASRGVKRIVQASSVNATGLAYSDNKRRMKTFKEMDIGLPLTEKDTPFLPEDAYSLSKHISEIQADAICRSFPSVRIASLRFHHVCLPHQAIERSNYRDFWNWTGLDAAARACWLGVAAEGTGFDTGHEAFFILSPHLVIGNETAQVLQDAKEKDEQERIYHKLQGVDLDTIGTKELVEVVYPGVKVREGWLKDGKDRRGLYDLSKAEALLGWKHDE